MARHQITLKSLRCQLSYVARPAGFCFVNLVNHEWCGSTTCNYLKNYDDVQIATIKLFNKKIYTKDVSRLL